MLNATHHSFVPYLKCATNTRKGHQNVLSLKSTFLLCLFKFCATTDIQKPECSRRLAQFQILYGILNQMTDFEFLMLRKYLFATAAANLSFLEASCYLNYTTYLSQAQIFELGKENDALLLYEQDSNFRQEDELSNSNLTLREESSRYVDFTKVRGAYLITRDCRKSWLLTQLISPTGHNSMIAGGPLHHGEKGWECLFRTQTRRENLEEYCNQESPQSISGFQGYFSSWLAGIKLHKVRMQPGLDEIAMTGWKSLKQRLSFKGLGSCCGSTSWISRGTTQTMPFIDIEEEEEEEPTMQNQAQRGGAPPAAAAPGAGMNLAMALAAERDLGDSNVKTLMSLIEETDGVDWRKKNNRFVQEKCGLIEGAVLSATVPFSTSLISSSNQQRQRRFFQCLVFGFKPRFELHHLLHLFKEVF
ncbi:hypothetical protein NC653_033617 [Populus alba x Populus x berolinensis]|uniref:Uncharacterized protein n=1 Tax=Populus alba x Populus x berolinensis TaxID=444605 RepID=A0AAD6LUC6_9ROSI|nr:hypothetical protein NC653_033617 [Populus alba x Populus x berolinensis]